VRLLHFWAGLAPILADLVDIDCCLDMLGLLAEVEGVN
jgi:hypothetical protein